MTNADVGNTLVTVTGASGFIALHCVRGLVERGYRVRGTLRSLDKETAVRAALGQIGTSERLSFVAADLDGDSGWDAAMSGATYVLHVASPLPKQAPRNPDDLIRPAREGALRALAAASRAGVKRVVLTSSVAAVMSGHEHTPDRTFDENDWSNLEGPMGAYERSKTLAERAAWEFVRGLPPERSLELVALNPVFVLGPSLLGADNASNEVVGKLLRRELPALPRLQFGVVDVRDVATAEILAMTAPGAAGERFILYTESLWFSDIAKVLAEGGHRVTTFTLPDWLVRVVGVFDGSVRLFLRHVGKPVRTSSAKARRTLGWSSRPMRETLLDTAASISQRLKPA